MASLAEEVADRVRAFPPEQQQEVLHYVEFLELKLNASSVTESAIRQPRISAVEAMRRYGGCLDGGPSDLSTNKAYMEGFGEV